MARTALMIAVDSVDATLPKIPYTPTVRPYLADPLFAAHWLFNTGDATGLVDLKGGQLLTPRADAGGVRAIALGAGGSGYTSAPAVALSAPPAGGVQATAIAIIANGAVTGFFVTNPGAGYVAAPAVTLSGGAGAGAAGTAVLDGRPTYGATSLALRAGGVNGLLTPFDDGNVSSMMFVARWAYAGGIYGGSATEASTEGGSFTYTSASRVFQNNMRGTSGSGNLVVGGTSAIADGTCIFGMATYDGTTRQLFLGGSALASTATTKTLAGRRYAFGNAWYKSAAFDQPIELMEVAYSPDRSASPAEIAAAYARTKARQALLGRTVL
ncbi:hypothetical protein [Sphingomonas sp. Leaf25]|uniref:hypothetical protein n=1 Tax=Sphingomonas sp. Leaf25 TaxID=1735692 RepID=UPI000AF21FEA|nr:hypothetical protein [Sphingomonas sp. Leaf25]